MDKICTKCKKLLPPSEFWKDRNGKGGLKSQCKKCHYDYRKKNRKVRPFKPRAYRGPACIEIRFCKVCGNLLDQPWPLKGVIQKEYQKQGRDCWPHRLCGACWDKKIDDEINRHYHIKKLREIRNTKKQHYFCPVCGKVFSRRLYMLRSYRFLHPEYTDYEHPDNYLTCSVDCDEKRTYAMSMGTTGINGIGVMTFDILPVKNADRWLDQHQEYLAALLAKEYTVLKRLRIDTKKEVVNGIA
jgi:hypothetical protein